LAFAILAFTQAFENGTGFIVYKKRKKLFILLKIKTVSFKNGII